MKRILLSALLTGGMIPVAGATDGELNQKNLSFDTAGKLAQNVLLVCARYNHNAAVTVVDRSGTPLVTKRMDNAGPHTIEASRMKTFTALSTSPPTDNVMKGARSGADAASLRDIPGFLLLAGGVPVKSGGQVIGAPGVGGAPGGHLDQSCALEGLKSINKELYAG